LVALRPHSTTPTPRGSSQGCRRVGRLPRSACHGNNFGKSRVSHVSARILATMSVSWNAGYSAHCLQYCHLCTRRWQNVPVAGGLSCCHTIYSADARRLLAAAHRRHCRLGAASRERELRGGNLLTFIAHAHCHGHRLIDSSID